VGKHASLRASDADRDQIVDRLRKAAAEGRLAAHELEQRVTTALRAMTYGELDATVADLPGKRLTAPRSASTRALSTLRGHPVLLVVVIPLVLVAVATVMAFAVVWAVVLLLLFMLGHESHRYRGPRAYARRPAGPPRRGRGRGRAQGYSPYRP
jgi:Domain of unknown function (DUF1707)